MPIRLKTLACGLAAPLAFALSLLSTGSALAETQGLVVKTASGPVQATVRGDMRTWYAIPFAAPPVGDLRWRAPQPATKWKTPIAASKTAAPCLQTGPESPFRARAESEDCLYLDVHAPAGKGPYPVMVWIHGGAFTTGDASTYAEAGPLVSRGVIVVAIHYRLGAMGFLAHPALRDSGGSAGDYGIMDQQAALKWVRTNISRFGGDAGNVTLFGESAGGFSVLTHLASPASKGLFDKAIIQSGGYGVSGQLTQAEMETKSALALKTAMADQDLGAACKGEVMTAACLRGLPDALVRGKLMNAYGKEVGNLVPSVDGRVLPRTIQSIFAAGGNHRVPVMNGSNEDENRLFLALNELGARFTAKPPNFDPADRSFLMTPAAYVAAAKAVERDQGVPATDLTERYYPLSRFGEDPALQPSFAAAAAATDSTFSCNGINISARIAAQKSPVWMYEFRDQTAVPIVGAFGGRYVLSLPQGAAHAFELPYLFGMASAAQDAQHKALQATMSTYWTNFARSGDPNGPGVPAWEDFSKGSVQALDVASGGGVVGMSADAFRDQHLCRTAWSALTF
ncbi:carboxylesterase/lipase family protein [Phenylobacterium sp.]|jgi:para-nitrobenzyl esterase|uniref:carboxylesterase/lipase family protein n=1 Tax=Phenylobacterium sp. TaxID=1871053 RepID=UPI0037CA841E